MNRCKYDCYRKKHMPFVPEEWNKLNDMDKNMPYKKGGTQYVSDTLKKGENIRLYQ